MTRRSKLQKDPNDSNTQDDNKAQVSKRPKWQEEPNNKKTQVAKSPRKTHLTSLSTTWQKGLLNAN